MKTKSIFISLLLMLFCISAGARPCVCPPDQQQYGINMALSAMVATGDLCSDCGHTKNCCVSHIVMPVADSVRIAQAHAPHILKTIVFFDLSISNTHTATIASSLMNRAPPWIGNQTPISLQQKLVI